MRNLLRKNALLVAGALVMSLSLPLLASAPPPPGSGTAIFDNSVNDLTTIFNPTTFEVGDQIKLGGSIYDRRLMYFDFEYWGWNTTPFATSFAGAVEARVRFYENNGALFNGYPTPSATPFFDSGWFGSGLLVPTGTLPGQRETVTFTAGLGLDFPATGLVIPADEITWSVQFRGMTPTDSIGLDIYSPPTVGQDYPDYWQNDGLGNWTLLTNTVAMDFGARMYGVPEPSTMVLVLGGLGLLVSAGRMRRKD
jgi:hypothetical protein